MAETAKVTMGSRVAVHYTGSLDDGHVFDTSADREPLEFTVGEGEVIRGFEAAVLGMAVGDEKTVKLPPEEAYGEYDPELVIRGPRGRFPEGIAVGESFHFHLQGDQEADGVVKEIDEDGVLVDFNHLLAGKALTFHLKVLKVG
jgi:peptidylprolyl isomerase